MPSTTLFYRLAWGFMLIMLISAVVILTAFDFAPVVEENDAAMMTSWLLAGIIVINFISFQFIVKRTAKNDPLGTMSYSYVGSASIMGLVAAIISGQLWAPLIATAMSVLALVGPWSLWRPELRGSGANDDQGWRRIADGSATRER